MLKPETILLVEDEALIAMLLERQFRILDCHAVHKVATGEAALDFAQSRPVDLVLMDIHLASDMDGVTAARLLCQAHPRIRVAFMTAYGTPLLRAEAQTVNPLIFLEKPLTMSDLELVLGLYARGR